MIAGEDFNLNSLKLRDLDEIMPQTRNFKIYKYINERTNRKNIVLECCENDCGKSFKKWHNLFDHLRSHSMEKPFVCEICAMRFTQKCNLMKHSRIHYHKPKS
jgi:uncharacterized Zn-finger protein